MEHRELKNNLQEEKGIFLCKLNDYKPSKILTRNFNGRIVKFKEVISKEVWEDAITNAENVKLFANHQDLVSLNDGDLKLSAKENGVFVEGKLIGQAEGLHKRLLSGEFSELSFGFKCLEDEWIQNGDIQMRYIKKMELKEVSLLNQTGAYTTEVLEVRKKENSQWLLNIMKYKTEILKLR